MRQETQTVYTVNSLYSMKAPAKLILLGVVFAALSFLTGGLALAIMLGLGLALCGWGIYLVFRYNQRNKFVMDQLIRQHCETVCPHCNSTVSYRGIHVIQHRKWPHGYILCPQCRQIIGHSVESIQYTEE